MNKNISLSILLFCFSLSGCNKEEGVGGRAIIKGKLFANNFHSPSIQDDESEIVADERIYIIYGNEKLHPDEDIRTGYNGSFEFNFLRKGKYKIYAYSLDPTNSQETTIPIIKEIEIKENKEIIEIKDFVIYKEANDGGTGRITGRLYAKNYNAEFTVLKGEYYKPDEYVYLIFGDNTTYNLRTRTNYDGTFVFPNLRKGKYKIYAFSKDISQSTPSGIIAVEQEIIIDKQYQKEILPDLVIVE